MRDKKRVLEALLFAGEGLVSVKKAGQVINVDDAGLKDVVSLLQKDYEERGSGFSLSLTDSFVQLGVKDDLVDVVKSFMESEFSGAVLKTLARIAFEAPIKQSVIITSRGNKAYGHISELVGMGLVESKAHKNTKMIYLTPKFFKYFNMDKKGLKQKLKDLKKNEKEGN